MRRLLVGLVTAGSLVVLPSAAAKDFGPGDIRVCGATGCVPVVERATLPLLRSHYYSGPPLARVLPPALGVPYYELRFRNGYVTGIVATRRLDRFLSYGVHLERFARDQWYRVMPGLARDLRRLTVGVRPLRLTRSALAKSR